MGAAKSSRSLLEGSYQTPETLMIVGNAYDDAWAEIAHRFAGDPEKARLRLAHAVLAVAQEHARNSDMFKMMALAYGDQHASQRGRPRAATHPLIFLVYLPRRLARCALTTLCATVSLMRHRSGRWLVKVRFSVHLIHS